MRAYEIIHRKREGATLSPGEIEWFIRSYTAGEMPD
jgi:thymidine phosphorylase